MAVYVGDLLTASAAPVSGKPTPTRTWQWLRGSTAISGATSSTYTIAEADIGQTLSVKQIETNIAGSAEATSLTVGPVESFTVAQLFASGEEGAWYEPSTTTAFKSTTDLTPCDYGEGCGFLLDKSQGAGYSGGSFTGLGSENVPNSGPDFSDATDWTQRTGITSGSASVVGGKLRVDSGATAFGGVRTSFTTVIGTTYHISATASFVSGTSGTLRAYKADDTGVSSNVVSFTPSGSSPAFGSFVATSTTTYIHLQSSAANTVYDWDFVSVRELPGNHATQVTAGARPILARVPEGGRRNLLKYTEQFDDAAWTLSGLLSFGSGSVVDTTATTDPVGGNTAELITENSANSAHSIYGTGFNITNAQAYSVSFYAKDNGRQYVSIRGQNDISPANYPWATFDLTSVTSAHNAAASASSIVSVGGGWYRCTMSWTANDTVTGGNIVIALSNSSAAPAINNILGSSYAGDGTSGVYLWGAQLETGSTATAYQKVVDEYDVTEAGVTSLEYLSFDGADDFLALPDIPFNSDTGYNAFMGADTTNIQSGYRVAFGRTAGDGTKSAGPYLAGDKSDSYKPNIYDQGGEKAINLATRGKAVFSWQVSLTSGTSRTAVTRVNQNQASSTYTRVGTTAERFVGINSSIASQLAKVDIYAAIIRCATPLTANEISNTEAYLANRSGVTL